METQRLNGSLEKIKEHWSPQIYDDDLLPTAVTTMQIELGSVKEESFSSSLSIQGTQCSTIAAVVPLSEEDYKSLIRKPPLWGRYFWHIRNRPTLTCTVAGSLLIYETQEEFLGSPGEVTASMSTWPELWRQIEQVPKVWRGIFSPTYKRRVLFSKTIKFRTSDLPRWKPQVLIDRRTLEIENE